DRPPALGLCVGRRLERGLEPVSGRGGEGLEGHGEFTVPAPADTRTGLAPVARVRCVTMHRGAVVAVFVLGIVLSPAVAFAQASDTVTPVDQVVLRGEDRKSTRLNSSHDQISYAVFCLKK